MSKEKRPKWEDTTSYQQGERGRGEKKPEPRVWEMALLDREFRIAVHRHHSREGWFLSSCFRWAVFIQCEDVPHEGIDEAKQYAMKRVCELFTEALDAVKEAILDAE